MSAVVRVRRRVEKRRERMVVMMEWVMDWNKLLDGGLFII